MGKYVYEENTERYEEHKYKVNKGTREITFKLSEEDFDKICDIENVVYRAINLNAFIMVEE